MQLKKTLAAVCVTLAFASTAQAQYTGFTVLGDSLSDAGTYGSSFTTNPGAVWSKQVSAALGFAGAPAQLFNGAAFVATGGNIWAEGGARVAQSPGYSVAFAQPVSTQLTTLLAQQGGHLNAGGLYVVWAGANDLFLQMEAYGGGSINATQLAGNVGLAAQSLAAIAQQMQAGGARNLVLVNLPDLGKTPAALAAGAPTAAGFSNLTTLYNATLAATLGALGVNALVLDANGLFNEIMANPAAYGITVTNGGVACTTASSLTCSPATLVSANAAQTYLFADGVHPSTAGHQIIADYFMSTLRAPAFIGAAADRMAQVGEMSWQGTDSRQLRFLNGNLPVGKGDFYVTGRAAEVSSDGASGGTMDNGGILPAMTVGFDRNFGNGMLLGAALTVGTDRFALKDASVNGSGHGRGVAMNLYGSWQLDRAYVNLAGLIATQNYTLQRNFTLGLAPRSESGEASGSVKGVRLETGYDLARGSLRHGPYADLSYRKITFDAYGENSQSATAMRFEQQSFDQLRAGLGYQASWQANDALRLSGRLAYEKEQSDSRRDLAFGLANTTGELTAPVGSSRKPGATRIALQADWLLSPESSLSAVVVGSYGNDARTSALLATYALRF